jgi:ribose transport system substrate-binding protein
MKTTSRLRPILSSLLLALAASAWLVGCDDSGPAPASTGSSPQPQIALVMKSLANEFFETMQRGAEVHQRAHAAKYDLIVNGIKDEQDVARQVQLVEQMIARGVDAIVIAPADSQALVGVCKRAVDAGIAVVNIDNRFNRDVLAERNLPIPFVGPDNRKGARMAGEFLAKSLKPDDTVVIIEGVPGAFNGIQRKLGFEDAMQAAGMRVVSSQSGNWETDKANRVVAALLTEHPDLKGILCCNDSMALGAVAALKAAGKSDHVRVAGFDNISAVQELIRAGRILCTVDQHGDHLAVFGIEYALEMLKNKAQPGDRETPVDLITATDLK